MEKVAKELEDFLEDVVIDHIIALENDGVVKKDFLYIILENCKQKINNGFFINKDCIKVVTLVSTSNFPLPRICTIEEYKSCSSLFLILKINLI